MSYNNPYAHATWTSAASSSLSNWSGLPPPNFTPISHEPYPSHLPPFPRSTSVNFTFIVKPDITNCIVFGPQSWAYFKIVTNPSTSDFTVVQDANGKNIAATIWKEPALVEVAGIVPRTSTKQWLRLSSSRRYRTMELYPSSSSGEDPLAIISELDGSVVLDMSPGALQAGLLDVCVVATLLLMSRRNIDL
ncbi:hypothetical protein D9615_009848 [Tricholomella constricta]|uniref:Uncharacterized protein n=1 Tax=Tricholomella constricta TaxID=117010 RepID=A0A8H5GWR8_9AGAR|nr:hypothetical protein D9615_009848 [Tricholomella constricta]